jgi:hypothetical protein
MPDALKIPKQFPDMAETFYGRNFFMAETFYGRDFLWQRHSDYRYLMTICCMQSEDH